jgi:hypothetical protein
LQRLLVDNRASAYYGAIRRNSRIWRNSRILAQRGAFRRKGAHFGAIQRNSAQFGAKGRNSAHFKEQKYQANAGHIMGSNHTLQCLVLPATSAMAGDFSGT